MCLEHSDDALIHQLQRRSGVRWQKDELDVTMQVLQHVGVGGSVFENHQDTEGEALRHAILLQLVHQVSPAARLENVSRHPTSGIGVLIDRQDGLFIALECTRVFSVVHQEGLEFAVSCQVSPQYEGETVLERFEARGRLLLPCDVHAFKHLPLQTCCIHVEDLLGLVTPPPPLNDDPETIWVGSSGVLVGALSFSRVLNVMEPIAHLKLIRPAHAGRELGYRASLLLLQVVVAIHGLILGVVKGPIKALTLPLIHPHDQHFLHPDHDIGLA